MFEDILSALQNFRHNKMRTLLSLLGIMIGVCSVVITINLSSSLEASVALIFKIAWGLITVILKQTSGNLNMESR